MTKYRLNRRFSMMLAIYTLLILAVWFGYYNVTYESFKHSSLVNAELAVGRLLDRVGAEFSQLKGVAEVIAGSHSVQEFFSARTTEAYFAGAAKASEIIRNALYPTTPADSVIAINTEGYYYRFTGGLSNAACEGLYDMVYGPGAVNTVVELDGVTFFCHSAPVFSTLKTMPVRVGTVVLLTHLGRTRNALGGDIPYLGTDMAVIQDDVILLSSDQGLEGAPDAELDRAYGLVIRRGIGGTGLTVAAAIKSEALFPGRTFFLLASFTLLAILFVSAIILFRYLTARQELFDAELLRRDMRINLLKSQIDAHFIVNTVAAIRDLAERGEYEKTGRMADGLAQIIRHRHTGDESCNLFLEFELIDQYVAVMNICHDDKYSVEYDVDDGLAAYLIPGLILQPIVENALVHGLQNKEGDAVLRIRGRIEENAIVIDVSDNGPGVPADRLGEIIYRLNAVHFGNYPEPGLSGVSLVNIHRRIKLRFDGDYGLSIISTWGEGTTVRIRLPATPDT